MPTGALLLRGTFAPFFTNFIDVLAEIGTVSFIFEMKLFRAANTDLLPLFILLPYFDAGSSLGV